MHKIVQRKDAVANGLPRYFTGKPCKHGHIAERQTAGGNCIECHRKKVAAWSAENVELDRERKRLSWLANREALRESKRKSARAYASRNKDKVMAYKARRRAAKLNATPAWGAELTDFVMREAVDLCRIRSDFTGIAWNVDHMVPLQADAACGLHVWNNLQVIPARMNIAKKSRMMFVAPFEWVRHA